MPYTDEVTLELDGELVTYDRRVARGHGNAIASGDPRDARPANAALERGEAGRCRCCWAPLSYKRNGWGSAIGRPPTFCGTACRVWTWRRNGDPDGRLDGRRAAKR